MKSLSDKNNTRTIILVIIVFKIVFTVPVIPDDDKSRFKMKSPKAVAGLITATKENYASITVCWLIYHHVYIVKIYVQTGQVKHYLCPLRTKAEKPGNFSQFMPHSPKERLQTVQRRLINL